jgi:hypothetical protein
MKKFKHSGAAGDLIYSLALVKHFGGGEFYLHLNQMNWIGQHYYGSLPAPFHRDRLNEQDFEFMHEFISSLAYITKFEVLSSQIEITHNLDKFRPFFVSHPGNYIDIYSHALGITDLGLKTSIRNTPWLEVPASPTLPKYSTIINRTARWLPPSPSPLWTQWRDQGLEQTAAFVGLPEEYQSFTQTMGYKIPYVPTKNMLELAQMINGADCYIGNQSQGLALAMGLGVKTKCELRRDLPMDRNECYFPGLDRVEYF